MLWVQIAGNYPFSCFSKDRQCNKKYNCLKFQKNLLNPNNKTCWRSPFLTITSLKMSPYLCNLRKSMTSHCYENPLLLYYFLCFRKDHQCDEKSNGPQFLTDLHNPNNVTCWRSDFVNSDSAENVTLTVSLKKKYELTYVSLHFCHAKPHSMAIYKR